MSDSTNGDIDAIVARIKAYTSPTASTTVARLAAGRVYGWQAPDNAAFPHVVVRKINARTDPQYAHLRENYDIEAMCFHQRPKERDCESIADVVEQSLLSWRESSTTLGLTFARTAQRDRLPYLNDAANKDIVTVRVIVGVAAFPKRLTALV